MQDKRVGTISTKGRVYHFDIGYITIPPEIDRGTFVQSCLTTGFVSIQPIVGPAIHRVRCDKWILQLLEFPASSEEFGSLVGYCRDPKKKEPYIVSVYDKITEYNDIKEGQTAIKRSTTLGTSSVIVDGRGKLLINVSAEEEGDGRVDINITNPSNDAQFNVNLKGQMNVYASDKIHIQTNNEVLLEAVSEEESSTISITKDSIKHDSGSEPMLLGQSTVDILTELINLISTGLIMGQPLSTATQIAQLIPELEKLLSQKSKLD